MKTDMQKIRALCRVVLLSFVLISIGFLLGKYSVKEQNGSAAIPASGNYIAVYYLHSTFRCETCNTIESMTQALLEREYHEALENGSIQWREIDFMKNIAFAEQFDVAASCVVIARIRDGRIVDYQRLDDVWTLLNDRAAFDDYIRSAIEAYLNAEETS